MQCNLLGMECKYISVRNIQYCNHSILNILISRRCYIMGICMSNNNLRSLDNMSIGMRKLGINGSLILDLFGKFCIRMGKTYMCYYLWILVSFRILCSLLILCCIIRNLGHIFRIEVCYSWKNNYFGIGCIVFYFYNSNYLVRCNMRDSFMDTKCIITNILYYFNKKYIMIYILISNLCIVLLNERMKLILYFRIINILSIFYLYILIYIELNDSIE